MGQYGISPERFQENQNLSSFFKVLTTSTDEDNKVLNVFVLFYLRSIHKVIKYLTTFTSSYYFYPLKSFWI